MQTTVAKKRSIGTYFVAVGLLLVTILLTYHLWLLAHIWWWIDHNPQSTAFMQTQREVLQAKNPEAELKHRWVSYNQISPSIKRALIASEDAIKKYALKPLARIVSSAVVGVEPRIMGIGPVEASNLALKKAGLSWSDIDIIELNEAFAAQSLACTRSWGLADNDPRINPNGGAIALGHPLGMSGARIILSAAIELHESKKKFALATMCIGVGQGYAAVIDK